jgi:Ca2+-binding EF-hand superfamily protein
MKTGVYYFVITISMVLMSSCRKTENLKFEDWDKDHSSVIEKDEFRQVFTKYYYKDWNKSEDPYLDDEDFYSSVYRIWDLDNDDYMSEEEWVRGYEYYYGDYVVLEYMDVDIDNDGFIDYDEYYGSLADTDFFMTWDANKDNYLDEEELANGVFEVWDRDDSGVIEKDEYEEFDDYYLEI